MVPCCLEAKDVNPQWRTRPDLYVTIGGFAAASATKMIFSRIAGSSAIRFGGILHLGPTIVRHDIRSREVSEQVWTSYIEPMIIKRPVVFLHSGVSER
jgi:hypothetical protein